MSHDAPIVVRGARREIGPTDAVRRAKRAKSKSKRVARPSLARSTGRSLAALCNSSYSWPIERELERELYAIAPRD